jgi:hypothetical protein
MRRRRSGTLNILRTAAKNFSIASFAGDSGRLSADLNHCTAGLLDLLARALGKPVRRNAQRLRNFTVPKHYHVVFRFLDHAARVQQLRRDLFVRPRNSIERGETDLEPRFLKMLVKPRFGNDDAAASGRLQNQFCASSPSETSVPSHRARRSCPDRSLVHADSLLLVRRTLCRLKTVKTDAIINSIFVQKLCTLQDFSILYYSTIRNKCGTFATAPRIESLSDARQSGSASSDPDCAPSVLCVFGWQ